MEADAIVDRQQGRARMTASDEVDGGHHAPEGTNSAPHIPAAGGFPTRLKQRLGRLDRHIAAALIMVVISVFGAIAAFEVALAEQTSVGLERRLSIGQVQNMGIRQNMYSEVMYRIGLET